MSKAQGRKCQLTINNPNEKGWSHEKIKEVLWLSPSIKYLCMADEQGQTFHTHIFFAASSPIRFKTIKNRFPDAHIEMVKGTVAENREYIQKSGKWENDEKHETSIPGSFEEWGEIPEDHQGERTDLKILYRMIKDGLSNFEIMEANPDYLLTLDKIEKARQTVREAEYRDIFRELEVTYIWGKTGTGKTRGVMEKYGYSGVYRVTDYKHPFDAYAGEEILLLDEFNSSFRLQDMLNYLDGYPLTLPARYANKVACFTKVYIISNICLSKQYTDVQFNSQATFDAFLRRIHTVVQYMDTNTFQTYCTKEYMENPFLK